MTRSLLKEKSKQQLSQNLGALILSGLLLGIIMELPSIVQSIGIATSLSTIQFTKAPTSWMELWSQIMSNPVFVTFNSISLFIGLAISLIVPVLNLGVHHVYLKATTDEKPHFSEMFSKMSQFGTAFLTNLLVGIFVTLWSLLLIVPGIIAAYSYSMVYYVLVEHPEFSSMEAIAESKRIMKGHRFELFVLQLSFIWWYLLCIVTFGLAAFYVVPYTEMAKANFYLKIKDGCCE